jgi:hypothetical protein
VKTAGQDQVSFLAREETRSLLSADVADYTDKNRISIGNKEAGAFSHQASLVKFVPLKAVRLVSYL